MNNLIITRENISEVIQEVKTILNESVCLLVRDGKESKISNLTISKIFNSNTLNGRFIELVLHDKNNIIQIKLMVSENTKVIKNEKGFIFIKDDYDISIYKEEPVVESVQINCAVENDNSSNYSEFVQKAESFQKELKHLINNHSQENASGTPDFILAEYITGCLNIYNATIVKRDKWHGVVLI